MGPSQNTDNILYSGSATYQPVGLSIHGTLVVSRQTSQFKGNPRFGNTRRPAFLLKLALNSYRVPKASDDLQTNLVLEESAPQSDQEGTYLALQLALSLRLHPETAFIVTPRPPPCCQRTQPVLRNLSRKVASRKHAPIYILASQKDNEPKTNPPPLG